MCETESAQEYIVVFLTAGRTDKQDWGFGFMSSLTATFRLFPHKGSIPRIPAVYWNQAGPKK